MTKILSWMVEQKAFNQFAHGRDPFIVHLRGTWEILRNWNQPIPVARCGLFHSAYTRSGFYFRYFDITGKLNSIPLNLKKVSLSNTLLVHTLLTDKHSRKKLSDVIGTEAEHLVYQYCWTEKLWDARETFGPSKDWSKYAGMMDPTMANAPIDPNAVKLGEPLNPNGYDAESRVRPGTYIHYTPEEIANYFVVFVADLVDQLTDVTSYISVYHPDGHANNTPDRMWPGTGKPGMLRNITGMSFFSRMLYGCKDYLANVPPVFNNCTEVLDLQDELKARDLYWNARTQEHEKTMEELENMYRESCELNPYCAEPHIMVSQLAYARGAYDDAAHYAIVAIDLLYQWGTNWDKQVSFTQWVGFARMCLIKAKRRQEGLPALPSRPVAHDAKHGIGGQPQEATFLQDLLSEFHKYEVGNGSNGITMSATSMDVGGKTTKRESKL